MSLIPVTSPNSTLEIKLPKQTISQFKDALNRLFKDLYQNVSRSIPKKVQNAPNYRDKVKDKFLERFEKLPSLLTGISSFLSATNFDILISSLNAEFSVMLKKMSLEEKTQHLHEALKKYNFEYYKTLHPEIAAKVHEISHEILPKKPMYATLDEGVDALLIALEKQTASSITKTKQHLVAKQFTKAFGSLPATLKSPDEEVKEPLEAHSFEEILFNLKQLFKDALSSLNEEALTALLHRRLEQTLPNLLETVKPEPVAPAPPTAADPITQWCTRFDEAAKSKKPESIKALLLRWFNEIESNEELRLSVKTWIKAVGCIEQLESFLTDHLLEPLEKLKTQFFHGAFSPLLLGLNGKTDQEVAEGKELLRRTMQLLFKIDASDDHTYMNKYLSFIGGTPALFDMALYTDVILPFINHDADKEDWATQNLALKLLSVVPENIPAKEKGAICRAIRKLIHSYQLLIEKPPEIAETISLVIRKLKDEQKYFGDLKRLSTFKAAPIADKVVECTLELYESLTKDKKVKLDTLTATLPILAEFLTNAVPNCSKVAFVAFKQRVERFAAGLKEYRLDYFSLCQQIVGTNILHTTPDDDPADPLKAFRGVLKIVGPTSPNYISICSYLNSYILLTTNFNRPDIQKVLRQRFNLLIEVVHPGISKAKQPKKGQEFLKDPHVLTLLNILLEHSAKLPASSIQGLKAVMDLYREWTGKQQIDSVAVLKHFIVPALTCYNNAVCQINHSDPGLQESQELLETTWTQMVDFFLPRKDTKENAANILDFFRGILKIVGPKDENYIKISACLMFYILVDFDFTRPDIETALRERMNLHFEIVHPGISQLEQPKRGEVFLRDPSIAKSLSILLDYSSLKTASPIHGLKVTLDLYREWTGKEQIDSTDLFNQLVLPAMKCFNAAVDQVATDSPDDPESKNMLLAVWKRMINHFLVWEDGNSLIEDLISKTIMHTKDLDAFFNFSNKQFETTYITPIDAIDLQDVEETSSMTLGRFMEPYAIFKSIWEIGDHKNTIKQHIWACVFDLYLKYVDKVCREIPEPSDSLRVAHLKIASHFMNGISQIVDYDIKSSCALMLMFANDRDDKIAAIYQELAPLEDMIEELDQFSKHPGSPGLALGALPIRYGTTLLSNVIHFKQDKQRILKVLLDYTVRHFNRFENDPVSLYNLAYCAFVSMYDGKTQHYVYQGEDGSMKLFNPLDANNFEQPLPDIENTEVMKTALVFIKNYLTSTQGESGAQLINKLENLLSLDKGSPCL